jgi:hypothetical protein
MSFPPVPSPLDSLPEPERIRDRLSDLFVEARLLRRLLRLSQAVRDERREPQTGRRTADRREVCCA